MQPTRTCRWTDLTVGYILLYIHYFILTLTWGGGRLTRICTFLSEALAASVVCSPGVRFRHCGGGGIIASSQLRLASHRGLPFFTRARTTFSAQATAHFTFSSVPPLLITATCSSMVVHNVKCVVIGDSGVGKSSLLTRFVKGEFRGTGGTRSTISAAFLERQVDLGDGVSVKLEIWDTAGQVLEYFVLPSERIVRRSASAASTRPCTTGVLLEQYWYMTPATPKAGETCPAGIRSCE